MNRFRLPEYVIPQDLKEVLDNNLEAYPNMSEKSEKFLNVLKTLKNFDHIDLSEKHYLQLSKLALYLEEYQSNTDDAKKYTLLKKPIIKCKSSNSKFEITIDFAEEAKLRVKLHNVVDVIDTTDKTSYALTITKVTQTCIVISDSSAGFSKTYAAEKLYDVKFREQKDHNYPRRCAHFALGLIHERNSLTYLFPFKSKAFVQTNLINYGNVKAVNPAVESNPEQKQAVFNIINNSSFPAPYILYGPPGTGKTATLVEAMCQLFRDSAGSRILVCTPSNSAADEITRRLLKFVEPQYIYRIYSQSKDGSTIDEEIRKCSNYHAGKVVYATYETIVKKRIVISTICNTMRLIRMKIPQGHFSHLIIDEAGHGIEPDLLIPTSLISGDGKLHSQIVLAGDPQQLGPTIQSKIAATVLGRSILERLMSYDTYKKDSNNKYNPNYITKLIRNFRSHANILHISNKLFYDNKLISMPQNSGANDKFPVIFHGVEGEEEKKDLSPSSCNLKEIQLVMKLVDVLLNKKLHIGQVTAEDIGIITPFALQSKLIQNALKAKKIKGINIGTVDLFQGQERKVIIMTTVRSQIFNHDGVEHMGFLSNSKRFNVAITRAKKLFIVVGNPNVLRKDDKWRMLMKFCKDNNSYHGQQLASDLLNDNGENTPKTLKTASSTSLFGEQPLELFILHEYIVDEDFQDEFEYLIDAMGDMSIFDDICDDYDEDNFIDYDNGWDINDDLYDDYEDFIESEDLDDIEGFYDDFDDYVEPEDMYESVLDDYLEPEDMYESVFDDYVEPEDMYESVFDEHDDICADFGDEDHYDLYDVVGADVGYEDDVNSYF